MLINPVEVHEDSIPTKGMSVMTISETIDYFRRSYGEQDTDDVRQHNEALDMAIKSLEAWQNVIKEIEQFQNEYPAMGKYLHDFIDRHLKGVTDGN